MTNYRSRAYRAELTPRAHAQIRQHLVLLPTYMWFVYDWANLLAMLPQIVPLRDFSHFYVLGVIARARNADALYDMDRMAATVPQAIPGAPVTVFPPAYGPQVSLLFTPLTWFSYPTALYLWFVLSLLAYCVCGYAIWRVCPRLHDRKWATVVLLVAAPALHFALGWSQISAVGLVCVTAAFLALRANRLLVAGFAIGMLAYKPQLGLAAAFVFVGAREWRIVLGAAAGAAAQLGVGVLYWGPSMLLKNAEALVWYIGALNRLPVEPNKFHMHSWRSFFELLGLSHEQALGAYAVATLFTAAAALRCWRTRGPLALRYSVLLLATILIDPHLYAYDLLLLTPALMLLWDWIQGEPDRTIGAVFPRIPFAAFRLRSFPYAFQALLYVCYFAPLSFAVVIGTRVQASVIAFALLGSTVAAVLSEQPARTITIEPSHG
jgi:alpha-1,2-mannosyltransferase